MKTTRIITPLIAAFLLTLPAAAQPGLATILEVRGPVWNQGFGGVRALPDLNGDGRPDIGISGERKFYIYFGGKDVLDDVPDAEFPGGMNAVVGDLNGDGWVDLVTVQSATTNLPDMDTVFVFFGKPGPGLQIETTPAFLIAGESRSAYFGLHMAIGDLDQDGYDDLVISAYLQGIPEKQVLGKVYIYMGKPDFDGVPDFTGSLDDRQAAQQFGGNAQIVDVNGDSYPDLVVGSVYNRLNHPDSSWTRLHLYLGGPNFTFTSTKPDQLIESRRGGFDFGDVRRWNLDYAKMMDFNNDGLADMCVTHNDWLKIRTFVFLSTPDSIKRYPEIFIEKPVNAELFFWDTAKDPGDINGDSYGDFAFRISPGGPQSSLIFYQGSRRGFEHFAFARSQHGPNLSYGMNVEKVGDQNGDGVFDIGVNSALSLTSYGAAYILAGNRNLPVGIETIDHTPHDPALHRAYPNPFHTQTNITVMNERPGSVTVVITDALGRRMKLLHSGYLPSDEHVFRWDGTDDSGERLPSGIYFYRIISPGGMEGGTLFLIR